MQPELVIYDAVSEQIAKIPTKPEARIYSISYSRQLGLLATVSIDKNMTHLLTTLTPEGEIMSEAEITPVDNLSVYTQYPIHFAPDGEHFLTQVNGKIYQLSIDGELTQIHSASLNGLSAPNYHPSQQKFAANLGNKDFDIGYLKLDQVQADIDTLSRSTAIDINAKFQPNGDLL